MIRSEKACKLDLHVGIVRANKTLVNDNFGWAVFMQIMYLNYQIFVNLCTIELQKEFI